MTQSISGNNLEASMNPTFIIDALLNTAGQFCVHRPQTVKIPTNVL